MADLLTLQNLGNLLMLCFLQAVLGFDNLLYISIQSQRAPVAHQKSLRFWGTAFSLYENPRKDAVQHVGWNGGEELDPTPEN